MNARACSLARSSRSATSRSRRRDSWRITAGRAARVDVAVVDRLGVAADRRERRAQVVAHRQQELLLERATRSSAVGHVVDAALQLGELVVVVGRRLGHPGRQLAGGDALGRGGGVADRSAQPPPDAGTAATRPSTMVAAAGPQEQPARRRRARRRPSGVATTRNGRPFGAAPVAAANATLPLDAATPCCRPVSAARSAVGSVTPAGSCVEVVLALRVGGDDRDVLQREHVRQPGEQADAVAQQALPGGRVDRHADVEELVDVRGELRWSGRAARSRVVVPRPQRSRARACRRRRAAAWRPPRPTITSASRRVMRRRSWQPGVREL